MNEIKRNEKTPSNVAEGQNLRGERSEQKQSMNISQSSDSQGLLKTEISKGPLEVAVLHSKPLAYIKPSGYIALTSRGPWETKKVILAKQETQYVTEVQTSAKAKTRQQ